MWEILVIHASIYFWLKFRKFPIFVAIFIGILTWHFGRLLIKTFGHFLIKEILKMKLSPVLLAAVSADQGFCQLFNSCALFWKFKTSSWAIDLLRLKFRKKSLVGPSSQFDIENTWPVQCRSDEDCSSAVIQQVEGWDRFDVKGRVSWKRFF